jgi:uncharacterized protein (UPF0335 family)
MSQTQIEIQEEKEKDRIVQEIHDTLEENRWGEGCDLMVIKVIFIGKLNTKPVVVIKNKPVRCLGNSLL